MKNNKTQPTVEALDRLADSIVSRKQNKQMKKQTLAFTKNSLEQDIILEARFALFQGGQLNKREFITWTAAHTGLPYRSIESEINSLTVDGIIQCP